MRITDARLGDDGGVELTLLVRNLSAPSMEVTASTAFGLLGAGPGVLAADNAAEQGFQVLSIGQQHSFKLHFAPLDGARALRVTVPGNAPQDLLLPALR